VLRRIACGGFALFALGQLVLQRSLTDFSDGRRAASAGASAQHAVDSVDGITLSWGDVVVDLDALYPPQAGWDGGDWSGGGVAAPWLNAMREEWLRSFDGAPTGALPPVTHSLHQTWKDAFPPRELFSPRWRTSLQRANPGWKYRLWTDAENLNLVRSRYPQLLKTYEGYPSSIQRADAARYAIAHQCGGFYFDLDYECFRPLGPLLAGASLILSYKSGSNLSKGASNSVFGSAPRHPFWSVVFDVLRNRSRTPLLGHTAVLFSTGPAVLREALRRMLRLRAGEPISAPMLARLFESLGIVLLDAAFLHPVTAERRELARSEADLPPSAVCTHHFVSSWVAHNSSEHAETERRRGEGHQNAAVEGAGLSVRHANEW